jgi:VanZ family protein
MAAEPARKFLLLLTCLWAGLIFYLSHQPGTLVPTLFPMQDKFLHFTAYAILGFLGMGSVRAMTHGYRPEQAWVICLLVGLYGISDEIHQYFIPGRMPDVLDVAADIAGGILGTWLMYYRRQAGGTAPAATGQLEVNRPVPAVVPKHQEKRVQ